MTSGVVGGVGGSRKIAHMRVRTEDFGILLMAIGLVFGKGATMILMPKWIFTVTYFVLIFFLETKPFTALSVACSWAGVVISLEVLKQKNIKEKNRCNRQTNKSSKITTNAPTNRAYN